MGRDARRQAGFLQILLECALNRPGCQPAAGPVHEQGAGPLQPAIRQPAVSGIQSRLDGHGGGPADRTQTLFLALAPNQRRARQQVDPGLRQAAQFGDPHAGAVQQFQDCRVAPDGVLPKAFQDRGRIAGRLPPAPAGGRLQQAQHFFAAEHLRQAAAWLGLLQAGERIGLHQFLPNQEAEKRPQARHLAAGGGRRATRLLK